MLSQILAIIYKESLHIRREPGAFALMLVMQAFTLMMGAFIDVEAKDLPIALVDEDRSVESRMLVEKINATRTLKVHYVVDTAGAARGLMRAGTVRMAVMIPADFHEKRIKGVGTTILAVVDGSDSTTAAQALAALDGLGAAINVESANGATVSHATPSLSLHSRILFNPEGRLALFLLPGMLGFVLVEAAGMVSDSLLLERDADTMTRLLMTPLKPTALLIGKVIPYALIMTLNLVLLLLAMRWVFGVPIRGNVFVLFGAGVLFVMTLLSLGVYLATTSSSDTEFAQKDLFHFILTIYLTGWVFPLTSLPKFLVPISYALPVTHMIAITRAIAIRDTPVTELLPHFAYLAVAPVLLMAISIAKFRIAAEDS